MCFEICIHLISERIAIKSQDVTLAHGSVHVGLFREGKKLFGKQKRIYECKQSSILFHTNCKLLKPQSTFANSEQSRNNPSVPMNWERQAVLAFRTIWLDSGAHEL